MSWSIEPSFRLAPKSLLAVLIAEVTIAPLSLGILTATLRGQAKVNATTPGNSQPSLIRCTFCDEGNWQLTIGEESSPSIRRPI